MDKKENLQMLSCKGLIKSYNWRRVVNGVDLEVKSGEVVGLLGPNGAGKTTTFYMVVGLVRPDSGNIFLDDADITKKPMYERALSGVSYLPQEASVFRKLTVRENILSVL
jgi:lipopolysaccharide export system ATP-binding protein